jgi:hypothetical protein
MDLSSSQSTSVTIAREMTVAPDASKSVDPITKSRSPTVISQRRALPARLNKSCGLTAEYAPINALAAGSAMPIGARPDLRWTDSIPAIIAASARAPSPLADRTRPETSAASRAARLSTPSSE